ncbi:hypothetical protein CXQ85_002428 [Candidozyma haemuli]|uniref:CID domain-containing protein n=1 Tax=Candidozyma haemuli TaxID=45357 RepID=A0A2V1AS37_9ASCO|nr:hypothetical protein CXQ85_002428 [[Candida] haemuloni]PVH20628.1 hypothetical protein CXQ85_002428 [[Candida] haemuloni]
MSLSVALEAVNNLLAERNCPFKALSDTQSPVEKSLHPKSMSMSRGESLLAELMYLRVEALITELTALAERHIDKATIIVSLIEERIQKILPKYKLYSFYLMDSIIKNVGNPYNLLFARNLHKIFTESYLVVTDTLTRQNLINLFKTWLTGRTNTGAELFPHDVLMKVEQFIIKATSLNTGGEENVRITRDTLLREANYLLQYVIAMDEDIERFEDHEKAYIDDAKSKQIHQFHCTRNKLILSINSISETVMVSPKPELDKIKEPFAGDLQQIRRTLDDQSFQQSALFRSVMEQKQGVLDKESLKRIEINLIPKQFDPLKVMSGDEDIAFEAFVKGWGLPIINKEDAMVIEEKQIQPKTEEVPKDDTSLAAQLGLNNEITHISPSHSLNENIDDEDDDELGYDPEKTVTEQEHELISGGFSEPEPKPFNGKSSLKRPGITDEKVVKRVRFDV